MKVDNSINIYGCCVSRDIFPKESKYIINQYVSFISPMSLMYEGQSEVQEQMLDSIQWKTPFTERCFKLDYTKKAFDYLAERESEWCVVDIADSRLSLLKRIDGIFTNSIYVSKNSDIFVNSESEIINFDDFSKEKWQECIEKFCKKILDLYPHDKIILIECLPVNYYVKNNELVKFEYNDSVPVKNIAKVKEFLLFLNDLCKKYLRCYTVEMLDNIVADYNHKFGLLPLHYQEIYYQYAYAMIDNIINNDIDKLMYTKQYYSDMAKQYIYELKTSDRELNFQKNIRFFFEKIVYDSIHEKKFDKWIDDNKDKNFAILKCNDTASKYFKAKLKSVNANIIFKSSKRLLKELSPEEFETAKKADIIVMCCVHTPVDYDEFNGVKAININTIFKL